MSVVVGTKTPVNIETVQKAPPATDKIKRLEIFEKYCKLLSTAHWGGNEELAEKFITQLDATFKLMPIASMLSVAKPKNLGKVIYEMWQEGHFKESADLIFNFFNNPQNFKNADILTLHWPLKLESDFIKHFLTSLPPNLNAIDFGSYHFDLNDDTHVDIVIAKFPNIQSISMVEGVTAGSAIKIANSLGKLNRLSFCHCKTLTKPGAVPISTSTKLNNVKFLDLSFTNCVDDEILINIANNPHFSNLELLHVGGATITNKGLLALTQSPHLKKLQNIYCNPVQPDASTLEILKSKGISLERKYV